MRIDSEKKTIKTHLKEIIEIYKPNESPKISLYVDIFLIISIIVSCLLVPLEHYYPKYQDIFWILELFFMYLFVIEYFLRWYTSSNRLKYPFTALAIIDLVAIIPTILVLSSNFIILRTFRGIRLLRVLRLIRLLKFLRYGFLLYLYIIDLKIKYGEIKERYRLNNIGTLFIFSGIAWILGANILYLTEKSFGSENTIFQNYWSSYWNTIIVLISGIEDKEPTSFLGKIEITILLIIGICFVAVITGEIISILIKRLQNIDKIRVKPKSIKLRNHIIILGYNIHLYNIIKQINSALDNNYYILLVSEKADQIKIDHKDDFKKVFAYPANPLEPSTLNHINLQEAFRVVILSENSDNSALMKMVAVYSRNSQIPILVEIKDEESILKASFLDSSELIVNRHFGEQLLSQAVLNEGVTIIYDSLMTFSKDTNEFYRIKIPSELIGKTFQDAQLYFLDYEIESIIPIGIDYSPENEPFTKFYINPLGLNIDSEQLVLKKDCLLIVIAFERPKIDYLNQEDLWKGRILLGT
ncbi:ion transporter [bacterium]|nr:ion transporter [bacterium]